MANETSQINTKADHPRRITDYNTTGEFIMRPIKNKKRRDPRYFLHEDVEESYRIPGSEEDPSRPGAYNIEPEEAAPEAQGAEGLFQSVVGATAEDFSELAQVLVDRVVEFNKNVAEKGDGSHIDLAGLIHDAKQASEGDSEYLTSHPGGTDMKYSY